MNSVTKFSIVVLGLVAVTVVLALDNLLAAGLFVAGSLIGIALPTIEQLALPFIQRVEETADQRLQAQGAEAPEPAVQSGLVTQSLVFLGIFVPLALFVSSTTTNRLGHGVLFGMALVTLGVMAERLNNPAAFKDTFLWQVNRQFSATERNLTALVALAVTILLAVIILLR